MSIERTGAVSGYKSHKEINFESKQTLSALLADFRFYRSGKAFPRYRCTCQTYMHRKKQSMVEVTIAPGYSSGTYDNSQFYENISFGRFYNWGLSLSKTMGYNVKNCYLCKHHNYDFEENILTCECGKIVNGSCAALGCKEYVVDRDRCQRNIEEFRRYKESHKADVWEVAKGTVMFEK